VRSCSHEAACLVIAVRFCQPQIRFRFFRVGPKFPRSLPSSFRRRQWASSGLRPSGGRAVFGSFQRFSRVGLFDVFRNFLPPEPSSWTVSFWFVSFFPTSLAFSYFSWVDTDYCTLCLFSTRFSCAGVCTPSSCTFRSIGFSQLPGCYSLLRQSFWSPELRL